MAQYTKAITESNEIQPLVEINKYSTILNYNFRETERIDYQENKTNIVYICDTIFVKNGKPNKDELIRFLIHEKYSLDDEIALLNNREDKPQEYNDYQLYRQEVKNLVNELLSNYEVKKNE